MQIPSPRGPLTDHVLGALRSSPSGSIRWVAPGGDDDEQLALWLLQELSFRRIDGIDPAWEEEPSLLAVRHLLESRMEDRLRKRVGTPTCDPADLPAVLQRLVAGAEGPALSSWMLEHGTLDHLREFVVHRAAYQLQEADPHSFAIPRMEASPAKTALLQLQLDEYGGHEPSEAHALLFARTMCAMDLEPVADLDRLPAVTLATNTLLSWFGRSRRLLPACLGHLAVFEVTSVEPMARYAAAVRRLLPEPVATEAARFYDVHVAADDLHGTIALDRLLTGFAADHPDEVDGVLFGAAALLDVERRFAEHLIAAWERGETSLRAPLPGAKLRPARWLRAAS
jgi:hypothetical protein